MLFNTASAKTLPILLGVVSFENSNSDGSSRDFDTSCAVTVRRRSYDGLGRLVKNVETDTKVFTYQGLHTLYEKDMTTGTTTKHFYADGMQLAKIVGTSPPHYLHGDGIGSTRLVMSSSLVKQFSTKYKPYGLTAGATGSETFMYTDKPYDSTTGLYYYGARYYDPSVGRFITRDSYNGTTRDPMSQNRYVYAEDDPMRYVDPTGHDSCHASPDVCYGPPGGSQYSSSNLQADIVAFLGSHSLQISTDVVSALLLFLDPAVAGDQTIVREMAVALASTVNGMLNCASSTNCLSTDLSHDNTGQAAFDIMNNLGTIVSVTWAGLDSWSKFDFAVTAGAWQFLDADTGGTLDTAMLGLAAVQLGVSLGQLVAEAQQEGV